jgi:hypothetical protein
MTSRLTKMSSNTIRSNSGGCHLTKEERENIEQMLEWMRTHPNTEDTEDAD